MLERRFWRLDTSSDWWDCLMLQLWDDQQWLSNFRTSKAPFLELCTWLAPALQRQNTHLRPAIPLEKRVAVALWKLATPDGYCLVGHQFGVGRSTIGAILMECLLLQVVTAINSVLLCRIIRLGDVDPIVAGFAAVGFPNCGGAVDGGHIPIRAPSQQAAQFINRKGYFLMVLQPLVDHWGQFTDICVGWSRRAHDAHIFRNSCLYHRLQAGTFFPQRDFALGDLQMLTCIVGDAAYPLMLWLMKPYTGHLDPSKEQFNAHLNRARMQVECIFGHLKGRFRCLDMGECNIPDVVAACCVLYNLVESKGEAFLPGWGLEARGDGRPFEQSQTAAIHQAHQLGVRIQEALRKRFSEGAH